MSLQSKSDFRREGANRYEFYCVFACVLFVSPFNRITDLGLGKESNIGIH